MRWVQSLTLDERWGNKSWCKEYNHRFYEITRAHWGTAVGLVHTEHSQDRWMNKWTNERMICNEISSTINLDGWMNHDAKSTIIDSMSSHGPTGEQRWAWCIYTEQWRMNEWANDLQWDEFNHWLLMSEWVMNHNVKSSIVDLQGHMAYWGTAVGCIWDWTNTDQ
jgi:hypothetical protein